MDAFAPPEKKVSLAFRNYAPAAVIGLAWAALYGPVYVEFSQSAWMRDENAHAPFILAIAVGAAWARLVSGAPPQASRREFMAGFIALMAGLAFYAVGRSGQIDIFTSASQFIVALSVTFCLYGEKGVRKLWFPLFLLFYLIVWPGWAINAATAPLKRLVSESVSEALFAFGLPVAHSGAVISAGPYELLVADACAGLNSLIALTSVGAVYLYVVKRQSWKTNMTVIAALIPLAIIANIVRVGLLVLITYYFGYDAGQSFLHEAAGLLMFACALGGVFLIDAVAARMWEPKAC